MWLSLQQVANLFGVQKAAISKHIKNIFSSGKLHRNQVVSKMETTAIDGKCYLVAFSHDFASHLSVQFFPPENGCKESQSEGFGVHPRAEFGAWVQGIAARRRMRAPKTWQTYLTAPGLSGKRFYHRWNSNPRGLGAARQPKSGELYHDERRPTLFMKKHYHSRK